MATIQCRECGKRIIKKEGYCPHCNTPIERETYRKRSDIENKNLISCPTCHEQLSKNATSCPHCGETMPQQKKTSMWAWIVLLLFVSWAVSKVGSTKEGNHTSSHEPIVHKQKKEVRNTLKGGYYACTSESMFDEMTSAIVAKDNLAIGYLLSHGCVLTKSGVRVSIIDRGFGTSKVRAYVGDETVVIYTNTENIYY